MACEIDACEHVRNACKRHIDDLAKSKKSDYPYIYDADEVDRVVGIIESFPHVKGRWARRGDLLHLEPWEIFILANIFGWKRRSDGLRRFRRAYLRIPRKNGKSVLAAAIGLVFLIADGEHGAEVYTGATTEAQAWEVFRPARLMMSASDELRSAAGVTVGAKSIFVEDDGSRFQPVIGKPGDGSSPSLAIADEYHEHDTPDLVETMQTGMGAREHPLLLMITTAGYNLAGPCHEQDKEAASMLAGSTHDDTLFAVMWGIDEGDDWTSPAVLKKANPNFGVSVDAEFLETEQRLAVQNPRLATSFKTKHLNVWCGARSAWMSMPAWHACADRDLTRDEFDGFPVECWIILDLASTTDVAAKITLFKRRLAKKDHFYAFAQYYLPEAAIENDAKNAHNYRLWRNQGYIKQTDGNEIDFDTILDDVREDMARFAVKEVVYDPWRATYLAQFLQAEGALTVEYRQTVQTMSLPMKELDGAVRSGRFHHDGNPVTTWMAGNVTARVDAKDNIYPRKDAPHQKIDGIVGLIMGVGRAMTPAEDESYLDECINSPIRA